MAPNDFNCSEPENGIEPLSTDYKSAALPLCYTRIFAAPAGLEPAAFGLTNRSSTIELQSLLKRLMRVDKGL